MYNVFTRVWWKDNNNGLWPNNLEPYPGAPKTYLAKRVETEEEARQMCQEYNEDNDPGRYARKAEFEEA